MEPNGSYIRAVSLFRENGTTFLRKKLEKIFWTMCMKFVMINFNRRVSIF